MCIQEIMSAVKVQLAMILGLYALTFFAVAVDFYSGVRKAKRQGELRTSVGYRKTVSKINQYGMLLTIASVLDMMATVIQLFPEFGIRDLPFATFVGCAVLCFIELRSVWENTESGHKRDVQAVARQVLEIVKTSDDRAALAEVLSKLLEEDNPSTNN